MTFSSVVKSGKLSSKAANRAAARSAEAVVQAEAANRAAAGAANEAARADAANRVTA